MTLPTAVRSFLVGYWGLVSPALPLAACWLALVLAPFLAAWSWGGTAVFAALGDGAANAVILWVLLPLLSFRRGGYLTAAVLLWLVGLPITFFYAWFGHHAADDTFAFFKEISRQDVMAFVTTRTPSCWSVAPFLLLACLPLIPAIRLSRGRDWRPVRWGFVILLGLGSVLVVAVMGPAEIQSRFLPAMAYRGARLQAERIRCLERMARIPLECIELVKRDPVSPPNQNLVIILGESTTRWHMSLYGYQRPTNPRLEKLAREDDGLVVYSDAITGRTYTHVVYQNVFTWTDSDGAHDYNRRGNLIQYLRKGGYRVTWITGYTPDIQSSATVHLLGQCCDRRVFVGDKEEEDIQDGCLLEPLESLLAEPGRNVILVELVGCHEAYRDRYPPEFRRFAPDEPVPGKKPHTLKLINEYDNAVLFNDHIVAEIIDRVRRAGNCGAVLYFSDHGDDVFDTSEHWLCHEEVGATAAMFEVPLLFWLSPEYRRVFPEKAAALRANRDREFSTERVIHTIFDMAGLDCASLDRAASLASGSYTETRRMTGRVEYRKQ